MLIKGHRLATGTKTKRIKYYSIDATYNRKHVRIDIPFFCAFVLSDLNYYSESIGF
jgi:hypothetical protein